MIAMPLTYPNFSEPQAPKSSTATTLFQPLDPGVLNESIPAFFIGRNADGFWLARDVKGQIGGIFLLESSALAFARRHAFPLGCATIFPAERFELDVENQGNPFVAYLGPWMHLAMRAWQRTTAMAGKIIGAAGHRSKLFNFF
jgi:hypothetical protein